MKHRILQKLEETFEIPGNLTPESMANVIRETSAFFDALKNDLNSSDETVRYRAKQRAVELKMQLEEKALLIAQNYGIEAKSIAELLTNPSFSEIELQALKQAKPQLEKYEESARGSAKPKTKKPKSARGKWLVG